VRILAAQTIWRVSQRNPNLDLPFGGEVPHALQPGGSIIAPLFLHLRRSNLGVPPDRAPGGTNQRRRLARNRVLLAPLLGRDPRVDRRIDAILIVGTKKS
jgi:hypothetical protein